MPLRQHLCIDQIYNNEEEYNTFKYKNLIKEYYVKKIEVATARTLIFAWMKQLKSIMTWSENIELTWLY